MKNNQTATAQKPSDILNELHALVTKAEKIISSSVKTDSDVATTVKERLHDTQGQISDFYTGAKNQVVAGAKSTHHAIRSNPYQSLAIAAGVGVLIGILAGRRTCSGE